MFTQIRTLIILTTTAIILLGTGRFAGADELNVERSSDALTQPKVTSSGEPVLFGPQDDRTSEEREGYFARLSSFAESMLAHVEKITRPEGQEEEPGLFRRIANWLRLFPIRSEIFGVKIPVSGDDVELGLQWKFQTAPAFLSGKYERRDDYKLELSTSLFSQLLDRLKVSFRADPITTMRFYRYYDDNVEALDPRNAMFPSDFVWSADKAEALKEGDLVELNTSFIFGPKLNLPVELSNNLFLKAEASSDWNSGVRFFVFRGPQKLIRIRLMAIRSHSWLRTDLRFGLDTSFVEIPILSRVEDKIVGSTGLSNLLKFRSGTLEDLHTYVADYQIDLSNPEARSVFDNTFITKQRLAAFLLLANPFYDQMDVEAKLREAVRPIHDLAMRSARGQDAGVVVNFYGSNRSNGNRRFIDGGPDFLMSGYDQAYDYENKLRRLGFKANGEPTIENYKFTADGAGSGSEQLFQIFQTDKQTVRSRIYSVDDKFENPVFESENFLFDLIDKKFDQDDAQDVVDVLSVTLPKELLSKVTKDLSDKGWFNFNDTREEVSVRIRYSLDHTARESAANTTAEKIASTFVNILNEYDSLKTNRRAVKVRGKCTLAFAQQLGLNIYRQSDGQNYFLGPKAAKYCSEINDVSKLFAAVLAYPVTDPNRAATNSIRIDAEKDLLKKSLYSEFGNAVIFRLLENLHVDFDQHVSLKIVLHSRDLAKAGKPPIELPYGPALDLKLLETLKEFNEASGSRRPDLRLFGAEDSISTQKDQRGIEKGAFH